MFGNLFDLHETLLRGLVTSYDDFVFFFSRKRRNFWRLHPKSHLRNSNFNSRIVFCKHTHVLQNGVNIRADNIYIRGKKSMSMKTGRL